MYVHPIKSIRALPTDRLFIGPYGIKFDREIAVYEDNDEMEMLNAKFFLPILEL